MSSLSLRGELPVELSSMSGIHSALEHFSGSSVKKSIAPDTLLFLPGSVLNCPPVF